MGVLKRYQQNPSVYSKRTSTGWILLEENRKYFWELNDTAGFIWEVLHKPATPKEIIHKLEAVYYVSPEEIEQDVTDFLHAYCKEKFIYETT